MAKVMVIANRKGGTAKTTTAVNLAYGLSQKGFRVLVCDLDNQGHVAIGFGCVNGDEPFEQPEWLATVPALKGLYRYNEYIDIAVASNEQQQEVFTLPFLTTVFGRVRTLNQYDLILVDTPPTLGPVLLSALAAADQILIPSEPTPLASDGVQKLLNACVRAIKKQQFRATKISVLPVMVDKQLLLHRATLDSWNQRFGATRLLPPIRRNIKVAEAFAACCPVSVYAPACSGAKDYQLLCDNFLPN